MQGFNRWIPPDYDPKKHHTLNDYHGKNALGDRERKRDQGILITRFELPFNIWCGTCNNHIGMGVRYNAEKKKVGNYYSTPIYSFRCKCHLCDGWFEIETDPKNTRYVVTSGARKQERDWDPEENGGFAIHDTDPDKPPDDPLASLEKTTIAKEKAEKITRPRIEALQDLSDQYNSDPYALSSRLRRTFREEKKLDKRKRIADDDVRAKFSLQSDLSLVSEDDVRAEASETWSREKKEFDRETAAKRRALEVDVGFTPVARAYRAGNDTAKPLPSSRAAPSKNIPPGSASTSLASHLLLNSLRRRDPFLANTSTGSSRRIGARPVFSLKKS